MVVIADGTAEASKRLHRVLTCDPGTGVVRHADAGYEKAIKIARERGINIPGLWEYATTRSTNWAIHNTLEVP